MKLPLWRRRTRAGPAPEEPAPDKPEARERAHPSEPAAAPEVEEPTPLAARPTRPAQAFARPYSSDAIVPAPELPDELPVQVSLTLEEAKTSIRAAGGDVIQVGFLASAYLRRRKDEPESAETAAARKRLCELVAQRLKDRKLLVPEGRFELLEEAPRKQTP